MMICDKSFPNRDGLIRYCARLAWHAGPCREFTGEEDERHV